MVDELYCYPPDYSLLKNKADIHDKQTLDNFERRMVGQRLRETIPPGQFDLMHLQDIHHHLFQDVYDWAGQIRETEINKDGHKFHFRRFIPTAKRS